MEYMTVKEAGEKWGLGSRIVTLYCAEGRIEGAIKKGNMWLIPQHVAKPADRRRKKAPMQKEKEAAIAREIYDIYEQRQHNNQWPFQSLYENKELFVEIVKHLPYPMHICEPDGTLLLANEAFIKFAKITNPEKLYKKHNILLNPNFERWGILEFMLQAYQGEVVHAYDIKVPQQEIFQRLNGEKEIVWGSMYQNLTSFPICNENNQIVYIVTVFTTSRHYHGREEVMKGKEYIDNHWKEEFDADKLAGIVYMSRYHYTRLFKKHTGMTPYNYYQDVKIGKFKEKLCDNNLSVAQVFAECGEDYNGNFAKIFKQKVGMTPFQYRKMITRK